METIIATAVLLPLVGFAVFYIIRAKRRGAKCIGCPYAKQCAAKGCGCCHSETEENEPLEK